MARSTNPTDMAAEIVTTSEAACTIEIGADNTQTFAFAGPLSAVDVSYSQPGVLLTGLLQSEPYNGNSYETATTQDVYLNNYSALSQFNVAQVDTEAFGPTQDTLNDPINTVPADQNNANVNDANTTQTLGNQLENPNNTQNVTTSEAESTNANQTTIVMSQDIAKQLAAIEPAGGEGGSSASAGGYGFQSSFDAQGVIPINDVGPIDPTLLQYGVDFRNDEILPQSASASLTSNSVPLATGPIGSALDETNLSNPGPLTAEGQVIVDFGADGPGTIGPNGDVTTSGSLLNDELTSGGVPVEITPTSDGYVGMAGSTTVFTLVIDPETGEYVFTLLEPLDHADPNNPDDVINIEFGVIASDSDGDTVETTITIQIADDAPSIDSKEHNIDETDLGPIVIDDTLASNFGEDGSGAVMANGNFSVSGSVLGGTLTSNGVTVDITQTIDGYVGTAGSETVFTLTINADGSYTFTLLGSLDHADANDPNDIITLAFGVDIVDFDGDSDTGTITINIADDAPVINDKNPEIGNGLENVDETDLGPVVRNGTLDVDLGGDTPATISVDGNYEVSGSVAGGKLTSGGTEVVITQTADGYVGTAGGETIFTLTLDENGNYTFELLGTLDHADTTNPDDIITIKFGVKVQDADGDTDSGFITVNIADDGPEIDSVVGLVCEEDLVDGPIVHDRTMNVDYGADGPGKIFLTGTFEAKMIDPDTGETTPFDLTSNGELVTVTMVSDTMYEGRTADGTLIFTLELTDPLTGAHRYTQYEAVDHPGEGLTGDDDVIWLRFGMGAMDADGDIDTGSGLYNQGEAAFVIDVKDGGPVAHEDTNNVGDDSTAEGNVLDNDDIGPDNPGSVKSVTFGDTTVDVPETGSVTIDGEFGTLEIFADGSYIYTANGNDGTDVFTYVMCDADGDTSSSTLTIYVDNDDIPHVIDPPKQTVDETDLDLPGDLVVEGQIEADFGSDGPGTFSANGDFSFSAPSLPMNFTLTSGGVNVDVIETDAGYVGMAGDEIIFTLTINEDGSYAFELVGTLDHPDATNHDDDILLEFGFDATDADGDSASGTIKICVKDDGPEIDSVVGLVCEEDLVDGPIVHDRTMNVDYGADGPGKIFLTGTFEAKMIDPDTGETTPFDLTSNGELVTVTMVSDTMYEGRTADGTLIFTLELTDPLTGAHRYTQYEAVDHPGEGLTGDDDVIWLRFGMGAMDADGDIDTGSGLYNQGEAAFVIDVKDGGPVAQDDKGTIEEGTQTEEGNVLDNDNSGPDDPASVTKITFGDTTLDVPETGSVTIDGEFGTLEIFADGSYIYTANPGAEGEDIFTYTMTDADGDTDTADLRICIDETTELMPEVTINNGADSVCILEDTSATIPVHADIQGGDGNEVITLTLSGIPADWQFVTPGWTPTGTPGEYELVLQASDMPYNSDFTIIPPADSDVDIPVLSITASVFDPDTGETETASDEVEVVVDAVADAPEIIVEAASALINDPESNDWVPVDLSIDVNVTDTDGSEFISKIIITLPDELRDSGAYLNNGVETSGGVWELSEEDLEGLILYVNDNNESLLGTHYLQIDVYSQEIVTDHECDTDNNESMASTTLAVHLNDCPLVIDLDGDGIELTTMDDGVLFDLNGDGVLDQTAWAEADDGFLAIDWNGDGQINDITELFGGQGEDGFTALSRLDSNGDGVIDANDDLWAELVIWQDVNQDGISQDGELFTLSEIGIASISLNTESTYIQDDGNIITDVSTVTFEDGSENEIVNAWFAFTDGEDLLNGATINGTPNNDGPNSTLGNDTLVPNGIGDILYGSAGEDVFLFQSIQDSATVIQDFEAGDVLDFSGLIETYSGVQSDIDSFVFAATENDGDTVISVDTSGSGDVIDLVVLEGVTGFDMSQLITETDQSAAV